MCSKKRRIYFDNHVKLHESSDPCLCNSCGKIYSNLLSFNEHVKKYHSQEFPCSKCGAKFNSNSGFKRHMRIHNKSSDNFPCDVCSKSFSRLDSLKRHTVENCNAIRSEFAPKIWICPKNQTSLWTRIFYLLNPTVKMRDHASVNWWNI